MYCGINWLVFRGFPIPFNRKSSSRCDIGRYCYCSTRACHCFDVVTPRGGWCCHRRFVWNRFIPFGDGGGCDVHRMCFETMNYRMCFETINCCCCCCLCTYIMTLNPTWNTNISCVLWVVQWELSHVTVNRNTRNLTYRTVCRVTRDSPPRK